MQPVQELSELENILQTYITFFIFFDIVFFAMLAAGTVLLIRFLKSKKNLTDSNEYLLYTISGQEKERSRIARELHDTVAQDIRYCKSLAEKNDAPERLPEIARLLGKSLQEVRRMSYNLSPADIGNGLASNITNLCAAMTETSGVRFKIAVPDGTDASFLSETEIFNLYRVVQESFTNIEKHAHAEEAAVLMRNGTSGREIGLYIFVTDDGCGFSADEVLYENRISKPAENGVPWSAKHFGIMGMKKRCQLIGADFSFSSEPGDGTQISIFIPSKKDAKRKNAR